MKTSAIVPLLAVGFAALVNAEGCFSSKSQAWASQDPVAANIEKYCTDGELSGAFAAKQKKTRCEKDGDNSYVLSVTNTASNNDDNLSAADCKTGLTKFLIFCKNGGAGTLRDDLKFEFR